MVSETEGEPSGLDSILSPPGTVEVATLDDDKIRGGMLSTTVEEVDAADSSVGSGTGGGETDIPSLFDAGVSLTEEVDVPVGVADSFLTVDGEDDALVELSVLELDTELVRDVDEALIVIVSALPFSTTAAQIFTTCGSTHCLLALPSGPPIMRTRIPGTCDAPRQRGITYGLALLHFRWVLCTKDKIYGSVLALYCAILSNTCRAYGPIVASYCRPTRRT